MKATKRYLVFNLYVLYTAVIFIHLPNSQGYVVLTRFWKILKKEELCFSNGTDVAFTKPSTVHQIGQIILPFLVLIDLKYKWYLKLMHVSISFNCHIIKIVLS